MLKIFDTLKDPQRFWCWLYTITLNKVRMHYRRRWRRRETSLSEVQEDWLQARSQDVLAELVTKELKEIVVRAVGQLEPRQRAVLTMRCYEQMSYEQISAALGCSQLGARALFYRAKKTPDGPVDGRTGSTRAPCRWRCWSSANSAPPAKRRPRACRSRPRRCTSGCGGHWRAWQLNRRRRFCWERCVVAAGGVFVAGSGLWRDSPRPAAVAEVPPAQAVSQDSSCWYYYPPGGADTVMIRTTDQTVAYSQWLQKEQANYYRQGDTIHIRNHRQFAPDLSVWRLPTDPPALRAFLRTQDRHDLDLESRGLQLARIAGGRGAGAGGPAPAGDLELRRLDGGLLPARLGHECGDRGPAGRPASRGMDVLHDQRALGHTACLRLWPPALRGGRGGGPRAVPAVDVGPGPGAAGFRRRGGGTPFLR